MTTINLTPHKPTLNPEADIIDISIFYETGLAQMYFDENFTPINLNPRKYEGVYIFTDWGNALADNNFSFSDLFEIKPTKKQLKSETLYEKDLTEYYNANRWNSDLEEFIEENDIYKFLSRETHTLYKKGEKLEINGFTLRATRNFILVESRGYSQGDDAEVLLLDDLAINHQREQTVIDNYLWDSPLSVLINGEPLEIDEYPDDMDTVKKQIAEYLKKEGKTPEQIKIALDALPEHPDYL